jgi:uncharacterized protein
MRLFTLTLLLIFYSFNLLAQKDTELSISIRDGKLSATLCEPNTGKATHALLIISGSGPTDRDGNNAFGLQTNLQKQMAHELAKDGIASLRYDKRMIGKSEFPGMTEADLTFDTLAEDAAELITYLKERYERVIIAGHSEGSLVGLVANTKVAADAFISVAGAGYAADNLIYKQLQQQMPALADTAMYFMRIIKEGKDPENVPIMLMQLFRPSVYPYLRSWFKYNPASLFARLLIPAMIIQGETDLQVNYDHANMLKAVNSKAELLMVKDMNHVLKKAAHGDMNANYATYSNANLPLHEAVMPAVIQFIKKI